MRIKNCAICGKFFKPNTASAKLCGADCRRIHVCSYARSIKNKKREREGRLFRACKICGNNFKPHGRTATCGKECSKELHRQYCYKKYREIRADPRRNAADILRRRAKDTAYRNSIKADPVRLAALYVQQRANYAARRKQDPEKYRARDRESYQALKENPEKYALHLAKRRKRVAARRLLDPEKFRVKDRKRMPARKSAIRFADLQNVALRLERMLTSDQ